MAETVKVNPTKIAAVLGVLLAFCSIVGGGYIAYDNAKTAKINAAANTREINILKTQQARFEGIIDERTKNTQEDVKRIYDIVKEWETE